MMTSWCQPQTQLTVQFPCTQGFGSHPANSTEQSKSVKPGVQMQMWSFGRFWQVPPFAHGLKRQLFRSIPQVPPCKCFNHTQQI